MSSSRSYCTLTVLHPGVLRSAVISSSWRILPLDRFYCRAILYLEGLTCSRDHGVFDILLITSAPNPPNLFTVSTSTLPIFVRNSKLPDDSFNAQAAAGQAWWVPPVIMICSRASRTRVTFDPVGTTAEIWFEYRTHPSQHCVRSEVRHHEYSAYRTIQTFVGTKCRTINGHIARS